MLEVVLLNGLLEGSECQRGTARPAHHHFSSKLVYDYFLLDLFDLFQRRALHAVRHKLSRSLADCAALTLEANRLDFAVGRNLEMHGDDVTTAGIAALDRNVGAFKRAPVFGI